MTNPTGIHPTEFSVLIEPRQVEEKVGSILLPEMKKEADKWATTEGRIIDMSPAAFNFITDEEWKGHRPISGQTVIFAKYAGLRVTSKRDGKDYILLKDKDIIATIEE